MHLHNWPKIQLRGAPNHVTSRLNSNLIMSDNWSRREKVCQHWLADVTIWSNFGFNVSYYSPLLPVFNVINHLWLLHLGSLIKLVDSWASSHYNFRYHLNLPIWLAKIKKPRRNKQLAKSNALLLQAFIYHNSSIIMLLLLSSQSSYKQSRRMSESDQQSSAPIIFYFANQSTKSIN